MNDPHPSRDDSESATPAEAPSTAALSTRHVAILTSASATLLWLSQPPLAAWPLALVALVPWLFLITLPGRMQKRHALLVWGCSTAYYLVSLQGLRYAHPLMFLPWIALSGYLAVYHLLFVITVRHMVRGGRPLMLAAPLMWVGQELVRNYLLTGISALMLGHTMANVPIAIQIADLFGSYGVGAVIVIVNVAIYEILRSWKHVQRRRAATVSVASAVLVTAATLGYGAFRLKQPTGPPLDTFALIQRGEEVLYEQSEQRALEIFHNYTQQTVQAVHSTDRTIDAVVWPESMFTAGSPWMFAHPDAVVPAEANMSAAEFRRNIAAWQDSFRGRARYVGQALMAARPDSDPPHLLVGSGVVKYADSVSTYSGVVSITPEGEVNDWYGKTHLVMFGEYIPIAPYIPGIRSLIPPGMGLQTGWGGQQIQVAGTTVAPVICIETAVERVVVNQVADLRQRDEPIDVVVTVTNDGWFDDSSVIEHHLRCSQLVAAATRRPILSAANNGPTAWIDSSGQIVQRLPTGADGAVIATPKQDTRISLYTQIGDWPARICGLFFVWSLWRSRRR